MKELLLITAEVMPQEELLNMLEEALTEFKLNKSDQNKGRLDMCCMLFNMKNACEMSGKGAEGLIKEMKNIVHLKEN